MTRNVPGVPRDESAGEPPVFEAAGLSETGHWYMKIIIGIIGRVIFWFGFIYVVGHAAYYYYSTHQVGMAILALVFFPITFLVYPWFHGIWLILIISIIGYWLSTFIGNITPID